MQSYHELAVAVTYITRLVQSQRAAAGVTCQALDVFQERLYEGLGQRLKQSWYPPFPEKGSALRAVHWEPQLGAKGLDHALMYALDVFFSKASTSLGVRASYAMHLLPFSFTLWIDPGCVSVATQTTVPNSLGWPDLDCAETVSNLTILWQTPFLPRVTVRSESMTDWSALHDRRRRPSQPLPVDTELTSDTASETCPTPSSVSPSSFYLSDSEWLTPPTADMIHLQPPTCVSSALRPTSPEFQASDGNFTTHDNGNVGVLGGNVKLGCAQSVPPAKFKRASHRKPLSPARSPSHTTLL